jgi:hypothetical protein
VCYLHLHGFQLRAVLLQQFCNALNDNLLLVCGRELLVERKRVSYIRLHNLDSRSSLHDTLQTSAIYRSGYKRCHDFRDSRAALSAARHDALHHVLDLLHRSVSHQIMQSIPSPVPPSDHKEMMDALAQSVSQLVHCWRRKPFLLL